MLNFAHFLDRIFSHSGVQIVFTCITLFAVAALWLNQGRIACRKSGKFSARAGTPSLLSIALAIAPVLSVFAASHVIGVAAIEDIEAKLSAPVTAAFIDGTNHTRPHVLAAALRNMCNTAPRHSQPAKTRELSFETQAGPLSLMLREDAANPGEYWVFHRGFQATQQSEVGRACLAGLSD
jgi:hypothetical protein